MTVIYHRRGTNHLLEDENTAFRGWCRTKRPQLILTDPIAHTINYMATYLSIFEHNFPLLVVIMKSIRRVRLGQFHENVNGGGILCLRLENNFFICKNTF